MLPPSSILRYVWRRQHGLLAVHHVCDVRADHVVWGPGAVVLQVMWQHVCFVISLADVVW
jgi:hypothetical protein